MATNFPSSLDTFTNPSATDTLDSPPHDQQHANINDAVEAIETALLDGAPLHIDDANERVGIGTASPTSKLTVSGDTQLADVFMDSVANWNYGQLQISRNASNTANTKIVSILLNGDSVSDTDFYSNVNVALRTDSAPTTGSTSTGLNAGVEITAPDSVRFGTGDGEKMRINSDGEVGIGTASPTAQLYVKSIDTACAGTAEIHSWTGSAASPTEVIDWPTPILSLRAFDSYFRQSFLSFGYPEDAIWQTGNSVWNFRLYTPGGNATVSTASTNLELYGPGTFSVGALSKSSGSFRIAHPLPEKADTHDLVHSFIEGPQADLIYRGRATLVDGQATVNIDESAGMTDGTFVALCRDIQCFTSNESGWTAVRGSVTGNVLTIEAQDGACADTVSWMVVGERQDQHMVDTNWTDETGKVIVEPLTTRNPEEDS